MILRRSLYRNKYWQHRFLRNFSCSIAKNTYYLHEVYLSNKKREKITPLLLTLTPVPNREAQKQARTNLIPLKLYSKRYLISKESSTRTDCEYL